MPGVKYQVYVIELSKWVFTENAKFRAANPQFNGVLDCLYVGMTSKTPAKRFRQHKTGYINKKGHKLSAYIAQKYGAYLRPSRYCNSLSFTFLKFLVNKWMMPRATR